MSTTDDHLTALIIGSAIEVHKAAGAGMLERAYQQILSYELRLRGLSIREQVPVAIMYKELNVPRAYFIDILVEESIVIEIKSVNQITPEFTAQVRAYLRNGGYKTGLLLNFGAPVMKDGIKRFNLL
jgi:GxxExxY protein